MPPVSPLSDIYNLPNAQLFYADTCTLIHGLTNYARDPALANECHNAMQHILRNHYLAQSALTNDELYHALRNSIANDFKTANGLNRSISTKQIYESYPLLQQRLDNEYQQLINSLSGVQSFLGFGYGYDNGGIDMSTHVVSLCRQYGIEGNDVRHLMNVVREGCLFVTSDRDFLKINDPKIGIYEADTIYNAHQATITTALTPITLPQSSSNN